MTDAKLTYEQYLLRQDEILKRAKIISARLNKLEFLQSQTPDEDEQAVTAVAAMFAALEKLVSTGVRLSLVTQLVGFFYGVAEQVVLDQLLEAVRNEMIMRGPSKGSVM